MIELIAAYLLVGFVLSSTVLGAVREADFGRDKGEMNYAMAALVVGVGTLFWLPLGVFFACHALGAFIQRRINALAT